MVKTRSQSKTKKEIPVQNEEKEKEEKKEEKKEEQEDCPICYDKITNLAKLDCCSHNFCYDCILHWSESSNTCPLCRERFHKISQSNNKRVKRVKTRNIRPEVPSLQELFGRNLSVTLGENPFSFLENLYIFEGFSSNSTIRRIFTLRAERDQIPTTVDLTGPGALPSDPIEINDDIQFQNTSNDDVQEISEDIQEITDQQDSNVDDNDVNNPIVID